MKPSDEALDRAIGGDRRPLISVLAALTKTQYDQVDLLARLVCAGWVVGRVGTSSFVALSPPTERSVER